MLHVGLPVAGVIAAADQVAKLAALDALWSPPRRIEVTGFFALTPVENRGISFGLFQSEGAGAWVIVALALGIAAALGVWLARTRRRWQAVFLGAIIGGAVGNVVDRVRLGWVVDYLDFHGGGYHWPAFNLADAAICVGVFFLIVDTLMKPAKRRTY